MTDNVTVKVSLNTNETPAKIPHWVAGVEEITFQKQLRKDKPNVHYSSPEINRPAGLNYLPTLSLDNLQTSRVRAEFELAQRTALPESTSTLSDDASDLGENSEAPAGDRLPEEFEGATGGRSPIEFDSVRGDSLPEEFGGAIGGYSPTELQGAVGGVLSPGSEVDFRGLYGNLGTGVELSDDVFVDPALPQVKPTPNILSLQAQHLAVTSTTQITTVQSPPIPTTVTQQTLAPATIQVLNPHTLPTQGVTIPATTQTINFQQPFGQPPVTQYVTTPVITQAVPPLVNTTAQLVAQPPFTQPPQSVQTTVQQPVSLNVHTVSTQSTAQSSIQAQVTVPLVQPPPQFVLPK